jgi:hypothetical protein
VINGERDEGDAMFFQDAHWFSRRVYPAAKRAGSPVAPRCTDFILRSAANVRISC